MKRKKNVQLKNKNSVSDGRCRGKLPSCVNYAK